MSQTDFNKVALILPKPNLIFEPEKWNKPREVRGRNCFAYAVDELRLGFTMPGRIYKEGLGTISDNLIKDGFIRVLRHGVDPKLQHIFAYESQLGHFIRLDGCGIWSHKNGYEPATNRDYKGKILTDPDKGVYYGLGPVHYNWEYYSLPAQGVKFYPQSIARSPIGSPGWR